MYFTQEVARYIIAFCHSSHLLVSKFRLQNLLYFIQAEFLITKSVPCFNEEILAVDWGMTIPSVEKEYRKYGNLDLGVFSRIDSNEIQIEKSDKGIIENIVLHFSKESNMEIGKIIFKQSILEKARYLNPPLSNEDIINFFRRTL